MAVRWESEQRAGDESGQDACRAGREVLEQPPLSPAETLRKKTVGGGTARAAQVDSTASCPISTNRLAIPARTS